MSLLLADIVDGKQWLSESHCSNRAMGSRLMVAEAAACMNVLGAKVLIGGTVVSRFKVVQMVVVCDWSCRVLCSNFLMRAQFDVRVQFYKLTRWNTTRAGQGPTANITIQASLTSGSSSKHGHIILVIHLWC